MTVLKCVELPLTIDNKLSNKEKRKRAENLLTRVGFKDRMDHLPSEL